MGGEEEEAVLVAVATIGIEVGSQTISSLEPAINDDAADKEEDEQTTEQRQQKSTKQQ